VFGITRSADAYVISLSGVLEGIGRLWTLGLLSVLLSMFLTAVVKFPLFSPTSLVEEAAHTYTGAQNYLTYGFQPTYLLQDFSTSPDPGDHPYVYTHMPPGAEILTAALLKISGGSYRFTRVAFAIIYLIGLGFFFRFAALMLERFDSRATWYVIFFMTPHTLLHNFDRHNTSPLPLLVFGPLVAMAAHARTGRSWYLGAALAGGLVASVYLEYLALTAVIACWVLLYVTGLIDVDGRHLLAFLGSIGVGIVLHLIQNTAYLGPHVFFDELRIVISNRMVGLPDKDEVKQFYDSVGLVHHGASTFHLGTFLGQIARGLRFPGARYIGLTAVACVAWVVWKGASYDRTVGAVSVRRHQKIASLQDIGKLAVWAGLTVTLPLLLFPAFAQEVNLYGNGTNLYFLSVVAAAVLVYASRVLQESAACWPDRRLEGIIRTGACLGLVVLIGLTAYVVVRAQLQGLSAVAHEYREYRYVDLGDLRDRFIGASFMTNVNPVTVGFLTGTAGHGVCGPQSVAASGAIDLSGCHSLYARRRDHYLARVPRYFFFFHSADLFPGFADCLPSGYLPGQDRGGDTCLGTMRQRLASRFDNVYENRLFTAFDLAAPPRP
jgi:hypothetical protein